MRSRTRRKSRFAVTEGLPKPCYSTRLGACYVGDSLDLVKKLPDNSVNLLVTSPPYALHFKKEYGNANQGEYVSWFLPFAKEWYRILRPDGSLVIDIGGSWQPGHPTRSLYHFELLIALVKEVGFHLAQEFYWYNPGKLPAPAEWVTVRKIRVKDAVNCLWWLSKTERPKANNQRVLNPYSEDMKRLLRRGYRPKVRPSGHVITPKFSDRGGSIPSNIIIMGNNDSNGYYLEACKRNGHKPHPARFPVRIPFFFINFLTDVGDMVVDPFAGSNATGEACERTGRRWIAIEKEPAYAAGSKVRFDIESLQRPLPTNGHAEAKATEHASHPTLF